MKHRIPNAILSLPQLVQVITAIMLSVGSLVSFIVGLILTCYLIMAPLTGITGIVLVFIAYRMFKTVRTTAILSSAITPTHKSMLRDPSDLFEDEHLEVIETYASGRWSTHYNIRRIVTYQGVKYTSKPFYFNCRYDGEIEVRIFDPKQLHSTSYSSEAQVEKSIKYLFRDRADIKADEVEPEYIVVKTIKGA
jgi:hypothetical protein